MILGLNILHNSSVCLLGEDGKILFAASEERFSRRKNETGFPTLALEHILKNYCQPSQISAITVGESCLGSYATEQFAEAFYFSNLDSKDKLFKNTFKLALFVLLEIISRFFLKSKKTYQALLVQKMKLLQIAAPVFFYDHHICHAASAYYTSGKNECTLVTLDGSGDETSGLICHAQQGEIILKHRLKSSQSVGVFYKAIVSLLGFMPGQHEGKITGLAAYGHASKYLHLFQNFLSLNKEKKPYTLNSKFAQMTDQNFSLTHISIGYLIKNQLVTYFQCRKLGWDQFRKDVQKKYYRSFFKKEFNVVFTDHTRLEDKADLAAAAQKNLEDVVIAYLQSHIPDAPNTDICCAGGVFANVKLNQKIKEQLEPKSIFIFPAMGDDGLCVGAAKYHCFKKNKVLPQHQTHYFLGAQFDFEILNSYSVKYRIEKLDILELAKIAADLLANKKIVGLYQSKAEFGPRALGHRSILANPSDLETNKELNRRLNRSDFMPFAPVVLQSKSLEIINTQSSEETCFDFMTMTTSIDSTWIDRIPSVVHLDYTARPQLINENTDSLYFEILNQFYLATQIPVLINTSFNLHEEPIINTPEDALRALDLDAVDAVIIDQFLVLKNHA